MPLYNIQHILFFIISALYIGLSQASEPSSFAVQNKYHLYQHETPFHFSYTVKEKELIIHVNIKQDNYLYKEHLHFLTNTSTLQLGQPLFPSGRQMFDQFQKKEVHVYGKNMDIIIPYTYQKKDPNVSLIIKYQGCFKQKICFPPEQITLKLKELSVAPKGTALVPVPPTTSQNTYFNLLHKQKNLAVLCFLFFIAGILLAFTPCVLPMMPILSATLARSAHNRKTTILYTMIYIVFMSMTYAIAGVLVGLFGNQINLQILFQSPWVITGFSLLFLLLSLAMFDCYTLQMPAWLQRTLTKTEKKSSKIAYISVAVMGICSALVVSPCVTAPLVGALLYISTTQNALLGGLSLFCLGLGMGVPLFLIGIGMGLYLPKSGNWMNIVKRFFGVLMMGIALWFMSRLLLSSYRLVLWGIAFVLLSLFWGRIFSSSRSNTLFLSIRYFIRCIFMMYGIYLAVGGLYGRSSFWYPVTALVQPNPNAYSFETVNTPEHFFKLQQKAIKKHQPLILFFAADWCEACHSMQAKLRHNTAIQEQLSYFKVVIFDITESNTRQLRFMQSLKVFGPPTLILYDKKGHEITRQAGDTSVENILATLKRITPNR